MAKVLVVEDEQQVRDLLRRYLERAGMSVAAVGSGAAALRELEHRVPDLILLDLGLPDVDGFEVLRAAVGRAPVVVLSGRASAEDRIEGLRCGADDYICKPFSPTEVVLRVQALLARCGLVAQSRYPPALTYGAGSISIDGASHQVSCCGRTVELTPSEWVLLAAVSSQPHRVYSREELVERLSGSPYEGYERTIDSHVKNLRRKLGDDDHSIVQTVIGFGYRFGLDRDG